MGWSAAAAGCLLALGAAACAAPEDQGGSNMTAIVWTVDNLTNIGGFAVQVIGAPRVEKTDRGPAVVFDGAGDGLRVETNPLEGLGAFTVEALFRPDEGGAAEQRFFHVQESEGENRVLLETRVPTAGTWYGDTFICSGKGSSALNDPRLTHPLGQWHTLALVYDGSGMTQYVNGGKELASRLHSAPMKAGAVSIGVRINKVSWFKGAIRAIRITPRALPAAELLKP